MKPGKSGITRIIDAGGYSLKGIRACWKHEAAFRQEMLICAILLPLSFFVARSVEQWMLLVFPLILILIIELLNTAIENVVDRIGDELDPLSGRAKDMGSAAVFFCLVLIGISWIGISWANFG